ncbi:hypothetical protein TRVL_02537 [Trypanosoma vivax]|nr:hypothetical protein TRVL_02537 [Trypanosoma vivax]
MERLSCSVRMNSSLIVSCPLSSSSSSNCSCLLRVLPRRFAFSRGPRLDDPWAALDSCIASTWKHRLTARGCTTTPFQCPHCVRGPRERPPTSCYLANFPLICELQ